MNRILVYGKDRGYSIRFGKIKFDDDIMIRFDDENGIGKWYKKKVVNVEYKKLDEAAADELGRDIIDEDIKRLKFVWPEIEKNTVVTIVSWV